MAEKIILHTHDADNLLKEVTGTDVSTKHGMDVYVANTSVAVTGSASTVAASAFTATQADIATSATQVLSTALTGRKTLVIQNLDTANPIWFGGASVSITDGFRIAAGFIQEFPVDASVATYLIASNATVRVSLLELN